MSNFSSEICPDSAESIYVQQCWELLLPEFPAVCFDLIHYVYSLAWTIDIFRNFVTILLILINKSSDGISCRAQFIYVLAGICRFSNDFEVNEWIFFFPKYIYFIFTVGLFLMVLIFRSRKDTKYDRKSIPLLLFGCVAANMVRIDDRLSMNLVHLSLILEAAALIAQSSLSQKKRAESPTVNFFNSSWFCGKILINIYYCLLTFASLCRFRATDDEGFRQFCPLGFHNYCSFMMLGYFYCYISIRKIQFDEQQKLKREQLLMCRSDQ